MTAEDPDKSVTVRERLARIEVTVVYLKDELDKIKWWSRWLVGALAGAIITNLVTFFSNWVHVAPPS